MLELTIDYGHRPLWAFAWLGVFLLAGWLVFATAFDTGALKPNNPVTLRYGEWTACAEKSGPARLDCFFANPSAESYPGFCAFIYSLDTLLPIVSLEMQDYWIPDEAHGGVWARRYLWVHILVGWALSLLAVAGFSGLVKSD